MKTINIQAAKTHLSRLVEEAVAGEEIILAKAGRPMVRLMPFHARVSQRKLGRYAGIKEHAGCWDPDPSIEREFTMAPLLPGTSAANPRKKR